MELEFSELSGVPGFRIYAHYYLVQKRLAQGDAAGAISEMKKADQAALHPTVSPATCATHAANHVMFALRQDDLDAALNWGNRLSEYADVLGFEWQPVPARLMIARGEKTAAAEQLQILYEKAVQADAQGLVIKIRVYQTLAAPTRAEALTFLAEALTLGQPEGFIRTFVDEGKLLAPLLRQAIAKVIEPEYARKLLTIIEAEEHQKKQRRSGNEIPSSPVSGLLSEREFEVLKLMAEGLSNSEIASKLVISLNTTKTHVHHILEKLNARGRTEAIMLAKELKLLQ